jgi:hypothetical protein
METENKIVKIETSIRFAILLFGLIGNTLTFIIFSRKVFAKNSINIYARALAFIDNFILLRFIYDAGFLFFNIDLSLVSSLNCKGIIYIAVVVFQLGYWSPFRSTKCSSFCTTNDSNE